MAGDSTSGAVRQYRLIHRKKLVLIVILAVLLLYAVIAALGIGSVYLPPWDILTAMGHALFPQFIAAPESGADLIILNYRLPRIFLAVLAGVALAVAGAVMQGLLRNPLVSPFTLGLSSAASFGAALMIVAGPVLFGGIFASSVLFLGIPFTGRTLLLILSAFVFGLLSVVLVYFISRARHASQAVMILAGVVIGYLFQAGLLALKYVSNDNALREIVTWTMGGMWGATWQAIVILAPIVLICFFLVEWKCSIPKLVQYLSDSESHPSHAAQNQLFT